MTKVLQHEFHNIQGATLKEFSSMKHLASEGLLSWSCISCVLCYLWSSPLTISSDSCKLGGLLILGPSSSVQEECEGQMAQWPP